jgi:hypothetical protein
LAIFVQFLIFFHFIGYMRYSMPVLYDKFGIYVVIVSKFSDDVTQNIFLFIGVFLFYFVPFRVRCIFSLQMLHHRTRISRKGRNSHWSFKIKLWKKWLKRHVLQSEIPSKQKKQRFRCLVKQRPTKLYKISKLMLQMRVKAFETPSIISLFHLRERYHLYGPSLRLCK